jgi:CRISPR system Cascade subunit CasB
MTQVSSETRSIETYGKFVQHITQVCKRDPGRRAALRRGLGRPPEQAYTMHATIAPWLPNRPNRATEHAYYAVAAMIADHPSSNGQVAISDGIADSQNGGQSSEPAGETSTRQSLGGLLGQAVCLPGRALKKDTAEKRLHMLVRQNLSGIHRHLPGVVRHVGVLGVPIDWPQLIADLSQWTTDRDRIAKRWLQDFYRAVPTNHEESE